MLENFRANVSNALYLQASRIESGKKDMRPKLWRGLSQGILRNKTKCWRNKSAQFIVQRKSFKIVFYRKKETLILAKKKQNRFLAVSFCQFLIVFLETGW